eukprot:TRINITY_DN11525_c0_g1_i1.p1 TRINITY_DN11525_c0_g1~~TRINITY_DN11525_c0_g1_i1.p1  ORF type:complete len:459 (+),score=95.18 TRINITY_DN11525_c0_g1_i1:641-2017(+)
MLFPKLYFSQHTGSSGINAEYGSRQMGNLEVSQATTTILQNTGMSLERIHKVYTKFIAKFPMGLLTKREFIQLMSSLCGSNEFWNKCYVESSSGDFIDFPAYLTLLTFAFLDNNTKKREYIFRLFDEDCDNQLGEQDVFLLVEKLRLNNEIGKAFIGYVLRSASKKLCLLEFLKVTENGEILQKALDFLLISAEPQALPNLEFFGHQAAGHTGEKSILKSGTTLFKHYSDREWKFYEFIVQIPGIISHMCPQYYGRVARINEFGQIEHFIVLEDLTHHMKQPCIMDLKMGRTSYEPNTTMKKFIGQTAADTFSTSDSLGFRICGLRAWQADTGQYVVKNKAWGTTFVMARTMEQSLSIFFENGRTRRLDVLEKILQDLYQVYAWFKQQRICRFYGSSILFVYDGADESSTSAKARMVDFAHVTRIQDGGKDDSYKFGLHTLISILENIKAPKPERWWQ